jgi:hypothetical protein
MTDGHKHHSRPGYARAAVIDHHRHVVDALFVRARRNAVQIEDGYLSIGSTADDAADIRQLFERAKCCVLRLTIS